MSELKRELGVFDAVMLGLGSILGTGVFVSIGLGAGIAGPAVVGAIALAALVAGCNALSSAQLAAAHPVSGGTYEYGYRFLNPSLGFLAGWMFLLAKSASAATAALGFAGYIRVMLGWSGVSSQLLAFTATLAITALVLTGIRRSSRANIIIVSITIASLAAFVFGGVIAWMAEANPQQADALLVGESSGASIAELLHATALMFVAYTGYGRIATLAEEVRAPRRTIPLAIIITLIISALLYIAVSATGIASVGAEFLFRATQGEVAPLELAARQFGFPLLPTIVGIGAVTAMLGVLLNLVLGLSRVALAMGRRRDLPSPVGAVEQVTGSPTVAVVLVGLFIAAITLIGDVKFTWSFSAFTVLVYYAITNAAALALPRQQRLYPRWIAAAGLASCLFLAVWIDARVLITGAVIVALVIACHGRSGRVARLSISRLPR